MFHHFLHDSFDSLLKFSTVLGACHHTGKIQNHNSLILYRIRHHALYNTLGQPFGNSSLTYPRFSDQAGIVLSSSTEDLNQAINFCFSSYYRIQFALTSQFCQITAVLVQYRCSRIHAVLSLLPSGILSRLSTVLSHGNQKLRLQFLNLNPHRMKQTGRHTIQFSQHGKKDMLCSNPDTSEILRLLPALLQYSFRPRRISSRIRCHHIRTRCDQLIDHFL